MSISWTRVSQDANGNPRYVCSWLSLKKDGDRYSEALKRARSLGGKVYRSKKYGGGIVFSTYSLHTLERQIYDLVKPREFPPSDVPLRCFVIADTAPMKRRPKIAIACIENLKQVDRIISVSDLDALCATLKSEGVKYINVYLRAGLRPMIGACTICFPPYIGSRIGVIYARDRSVSFLELNREFRIYCSFISDGLHECVIVDGEGNAVKRKGGIQYYRNAFKYGQNRIAALRSAA